MAVFTIDPANSVVANGFGVHAFNNDSAGADTLAVNAGAYLIATDSGLGAILANTGAWEVTINGLVSSTKHNGIYLEENNTALSTITIGVDGEVSGAAAGGFAGIGARSAINLTNAGTVSGDRWAIFAEAAATITNSGTIAATDPAFGTGVLLASTGAHTFTNSGVVSALTAFFDSGGGDDEVTNTGTLAGNVGLGEGANQLTNSGLIDGRVSGGANNDRVINFNTITGSNSTIGALFLRDGNNTVTNTGTIGEDLTLNAIVTGIGNDTVTNSKDIIGNVVLGDGVDKLTNSGTILGIFNLGGGNDTVTNSGTIDGVTGGTIDFGTEDDRLENTGTIDVSAISFGDGNDKLVNFEFISAAITLGDGANTVINWGTLTGNVIEIFGGSGVDDVTNRGLLGGTTDLGAGDDFFTGDAGLERVRDNGGSDTTKFRDGNDVYFAVRNFGGGDGSDFINGGAGIDTYDASNATGGVATSSVRINLDTVEHEFAPSAQPLIGANTAIGADVDGGAGTKDTVVSFENAKGGSAGDLIYGSEVANVLEGNGGADFLFGFAGNDSLIGGAGADQLFGGVGADTLNGGIDGSVDTFHFRTVSQSGVGTSKRDKIVSFEDGFDRIDLSLIDALAGTPAEDAFTYLNGNGTTTPAIDFTGNAQGGDLRSIRTATGYIIEGDVNGDKSADFSIEIVDPTHVITLTIEDFVL